MSSENSLKVGLYRLLIWLDVRPPDIRPIIFPDTGYPAKNKFYFNVKKSKVFIIFPFISFNFHFLSLNHDFSDIKNSCH